MVSKAEDWAVLRMLSGAVSRKPRAEGAGEDERGRLRGPLGHAWVDIVEQCVFVVVINSGEGGGRGV